MKTIAVIEGFSGGPILTKNFRQALVGAGLKIVHDVRKADIIFAHSAACYGVPLNIRAELVVLVGPPYWPGQSIGARLIRTYKALKEHDLEKFGRSYYFKKKCAGLLYAVIRPKLLWWGITKNRSLGFLSLPAKNMLIVRNTEDTYCSPQIKDMLKDQAKYVELPGVHDDYITNPGPYIKLIQSNL
jgi:hypothetical protein